MNFLFFRLLVASIAMLGLSHSLFASGPVSAFPDATLDKWKEEAFIGNTRYELLNEEGVRVLKATANKTASVLYKRHTIDLKRTPWLDWSWKVDSVYNGIDETKKAGDDFPARLYVTARVGLLPWDTVALNYVWSSNQPVGTVWPNPHTAKSIMIAMQSGDEKAGQWVTQRRNIADDFKSLFNIDVTHLLGYAVMVDGDNSAQVGSAYFGGIHFSRK